MNKNRISPDQGLTPVDYLDAVSAIKSAKAYKARSFDLLDIKQGHQVLEVGCGNGDDCYEMSKMVGTQGQVTGIDVNPAMISEAWKRYSGKTSALDFKLQDVHSLPYEDNTFDIGRSDRVFQHLSDPAVALSQMHRVLRPQGKIVIIEPDWETLVIDHEDKQTTRLLVDFLCDECVPHGWIGRQLPGIFKRAGFKNIQVSGEVFIVTSLAIADEIWGLKSYLSVAVDKKIISPEAFSSWREHLVTRSENNNFFTSLTGFLVLAEK